MQFTRLRLEGFKSFVDPTELVIEQGLTGVVGPNGCGKSNLLEALRWVMGESRAKQMRGEGMEDVIFAGCDGRPARARAAVELVIDNGAGTAPLAWRELPVIEIARRIRRDTGSDYRLNGKLVRARDVQMLFADAATGATSPALVRQGQIAEIINAKPKARRRILEDAAGISGLYQRRHESLLKLSAAETNLSRVDDVLEALAQQLATLEKQAATAKRYREIAAALEAAEGTLLQARHARAASSHASAERTRRDGIRKRAASEAEAARAETVRAEAEAAIAPLREEATVAAAVRQRAMIEREQLEGREKAAQAEIEAARAAVSQVEEDRAREARLADDASAALARLAEQRDALDRASEGAEARLAAARARAAEGVAAQAEADRALDAATSAAAAAGAARESALRGLQDAKARAERASADRDRLAEAEPRQSADAQRTADEAMAARARAAAAAEAVAAAEAERETASTAATAGAEAAATARRDRAAAEAALAAITSERRGLERLVARDAVSGGVIDVIEVEPGLEAALGAALAEDLDAPLVDPADERPATGWTPASEPPATDPISPPG
ncbi:MAG: AAA family ATPase, partial [Pseudomonadota bacterium]